MARALDLVGERWALLVVRELLLGPKRFTDLREGLPHVSPDVLSQRLGELEQAGILLRRKLAPPAGSRVYELTPWGHGLEPVIVQLGRWGSRAPFPPPGAELGVDSLILALQTVFHPSSAAGLSASYELRLGEHRFRVEIADGEIELARGSAEAPDAVIVTDPGTLSAVIWHDRPLAEALRAQDIEIEGSQAAVTRLLGLFPLPAPAPAPASPRGHTRADAATH